MNFAAKLNRLMSLSGISNIKLARALNVDPSLVSRWRNGSRSPVKNLDTLARLSAFMCQNLPVDQRGSLCMLVGEPTTLSGAKLEKCLLQWLQSNESGQRKQPETRSAQQQEQRSYAQASNIVMTGPRGRKQVLGELFRLFDPQIPNETIRFYSNEPADWIGEDIAFRETLSASDPTRFDNISHLKLILHTNSTPEELVGTIHYIKPFLRNSRVEVMHIPRYRKETLAHTMLVAGQSSAATSNGFTGSSNFIVNLFTDKAFIQKLCADFDTLFDACEPVHSTIPSPKPAEILEDISSMADVDEPITFLGNALPAFLVPRELIDEAVLHVPDSLLGHDFQGIFAVNRAKYSHFLTKQKYYLYMPLYTPEEIESGALSVACLPRFNAGEPFWTPRQYYLLLQSLQQHCQTYPNLFLYIIPELTHEFSSLFQPNSACRFTKCPPNSVMYETRIGSYIHAFLRYVAEQYASPATLAAQRAQQMKKLDEHIQLLASYLAG